MTGDSVNRGNHGGKTPVPEEMKARREYTVAFFWQGIVWSGELRDHKKQGRWGKRTKAAGKRSGNCWPLWGDQKKGG